MIKVTIIDKEINLHGFFNNQTKADKYIDKIENKYNITDILSKTTIETLPDKSQKELDHDEKTLIAVKLKDGSVKLDDVARYLVLRDNL